MGCAIDDCGSKSQRAPSHEIGGTLLDHVTTNYSGRAKYSRPCLLPSCPRQASRASVSSHSIAGTLAICSLLVVNTQSLYRGLKYVSKNLEERIETIAHELSNSDYDLIGLQEIWVFAHYQRVQQRVVRRLPHSKFFYRYISTSNQIEEWAVSQQPLLSLVVL